MKDEIPTFHVDNSIDREIFYDENLAKGRLRVAGLFFGYTGLGWGVHALVMWLFFRTA